MSAPFTPEAVLATLPDLATPPASGLKRFRVTVIEWLSHVIILDAKDAAAAEDLAAHLWSELGGDAFRFSDQGIDGFHADEIAEGAL